MTECTTYALQQALKALSLLEYRADGNVHFFPIQEQVDEAITSINKALEQEDQLT